MWRMASATTNINGQDFGIKLSQTLNNGGSVVANGVAATPDVEMIQSAE